MIAFIAAFALTSASGAWTVLEEPPAIDGEGSHDTVEPAPAPTVTRDWSLLPNAIQIVSPDGTTLGGWRSEQRCSSQPVLSDPGPEGSAESARHTSPSPAAGAVSDGCLNMLTRNLGGGETQIAMAGGVLAPGYMRTGRGQEIVFIPPPQP